MKRYNYWTRNLIEKFKNIFYEFNYVYAYLSSKRRERERSLVWSVRISHG